MKNRKQKLESPNEGPLIKKKLLLIENALSKKITGFMKKKLMVEHDRLTDKLEFIQ